MSSPSLPALLAVVVAVPAGVARAQAESAPAASTGHVVSFRPVVWAPEIDGDVRLEDVFGSASKLDLDSDLDLGDRSTEFAGDVNLRLGRHDLWISGFQFSVSGLETIGQDIVFGDVSATVSDTLASEVDLDHVRVRYGYSILGLGEGGPRLSLTVAANYYGLETSVESLQTGLRDEVEAHIPFPTFGVHFELPLGSWQLGADLSGLFIEIDDLQSAYLDVAASLSWSPVNNINIVGGYRAIRLDAGASDYTFDSILHGPFAGVEIRF